MAWKQITVDFTSKENYVRNGMHSTYKGSWNPITSSRDYLRDQYIDKLIISKSLRRPAWFHIHYPAGKSWQKNFYETFSILQRYCYVFTQLSQIMKYKKIERERTGSFLSNQCKFVLWKRKPISLYLGAGEKSVEFYLPQIYQRLSPAKWLVFLVPTVVSGN